MCSHHAWCASSKTWRPTGIALDARIEGLSGEIERLARQDKGCERLMTVPGIGPIISSAMMAAIGTGDAFSKGRDFGAWLGLVPKQISTGNRTILGSISRGGNAICAVCLFRLPGLAIFKMLFDLGDSTIEPFLYPPQGTLNFAVVVHFLWSSLPRA
jgi:Transposase IS116/IS110/IS902 family